MGTRLFAVKQLTNTVCRTPEAVYFTGIDKRILRLNVDFPVDMLSTNQDAESVLITKLHEAILPVIEDLYRERWNLLAGKNLGIDPKPMPERWEDL